MLHCPRLIPKPARRVPPRAPWVVLRAAAVVLALLCVGSMCRAQQHTHEQRREAEAMLRNVDRDVQQHYFDPLALGSDWELRVHATREKIERADSFNRALSHIAALLDSLNDSHTYFVPPPRPYRLDYGFQMEMIGDRCRVTRVRAGSDAEKKGLRAGEEIVTVDGFAPTRGDFWRMHFVFWVLQPQEELRLGVRDGVGSPRQMKVLARLRPLAGASDRTGSALFDSMREMETQQDAQRPAFAERGKGLLVVKLPQMTLSRSEVDAVLGRMEKHAAVILDLRGNPGGSQEALRSLLGGMFDKAIEMGTLVSSRATTKLTSEPHRHSYRGKLAVLIDSKSSSAAELFARVIQLQKRGLVLGDRSAGRVMAAEQHMHQQGMASGQVYGSIVTEAEIRMSDGQSLEHNGITPDALLLPSAADLASGRDPVLAAAAERLHVALSAEEAGALFPSHWTGE